MTVMMTSTVSDRAAMMTTAYTGVVGDEEVLGGWEVREMGEEKEEEEEEGGEVGLVDGLVVDKLGSVVTVCVRGE